MRLQQYETQGLQASSGRLLDFTQSWYRRVEVGGVQEAARAGLQ